MTDKSSYSFELEALLRLKKYM